MSPRKSPEELATLLLHLQRENAELQKQLEIYKNLVERDLLIPSVYNRTGFKSAVRPIIREVFNLKTEDLRIGGVVISVVSIVFIDIDNFKAVNDTAGHDAGDEILLRLGGLLRERLRRTDIVARWGGDEFVIALVNRTKTETAARVQEIADEFARTEYEFDLSLPVSISFGVACTGEFIDLETLITAADRRMRSLKKAKGIGR